MRLRLTLTAGLLTGALAGTAPAALAGASDPRPDDPAPTSRPAPTAPDWAVTGGYPDQTSDDVPGPVARRVPSFLRGGPVTSRIRRSDVIPGLTLTQWDQHDARGPLRFQLLVIDTRQRGLTLDYGSAGRVARTAPLTSILQRHGAVAGVNGDFFDIGDTGAPLGLGRQRGKAVRHAPETGWNNAFFITRQGRPDIDVLPMVGRVRTADRDLEITNVNSPSVRPGGIGVYTRVWGSSPGYRVTDGQKRHVRVVEVRKGVVRGEARRLREGERIRGSLLVGRGDGARQLRRLEVGDRARLSWWLRGGPRMAISGNLFLVREGVTKPIDDREMHPRTAVGIDHDTGEVLLLAVDGRQSFSRGQTMVELARTMVDLGADEALNLDGGGSTTMAVRRDGRYRVVNSPSDGSQRAVPNALEVHYRPR